MSLGKVSGLDERSLLHGELDVVMPKRWERERVHGLKRVGEREKIQIRTFIHQLENV